MRRRRLRELAQICCKVASPYDVRAPARVAELVYAMDSKSIVRKGMRVRVPPRALTIRRATAGDARKLAELHVASWQRGYKGVVPDWYLARQSVDHRYGQWVDSWSRSARSDAMPGDTALWVFEGNERALSFYARHGYVRDGATHVHEPTGLTEVRMTRE